MQTRLTSTLLILILALALSGCVTAPLLTTPKATTEMMKRHAELEAQALKAHRENAWARIKELTAIYENADAERTPGLVGLAKDLRAAQAAVEANGGLNFDALKADELVTTNPNFWRAMMEVAPADGSIVLLQASVLTCAGEYWRASRLMRAMNQLMTLNRAVKPVFLAPVYGFAYYVNLRSLGLKLQTEGLTKKDEQALIDRLVAENPRDPMLLLASIDNGLRLFLMLELPPEKSDFKAAVAKLVDEGLARNKDRVEILRRCDPLLAIEYRGDGESRKAGRELVAKWNKMVNLDTVWSEAQLGELKDGLAKAEMWEYALLIQRLQTNARGFAKQSDRELWENALPKLLGEAKAGELLSVMQRGEIMVVSLNLPQQGPALWTGDKRIHPAYLQQQEREIAEFSFQIGIAADDKQRKSEAYIRRGVAQTRCGLFSEAAADFAEAETLTGRELTLLRARLITALAKGDEAEAKALAAEINAKPALRDHARAALGLWACTLGDFKRAQKYFSARSKDDLFAVMMAELSARRATGQTDKATLLAARKKLPEKSWLYRQFDYLLGESSDEDLLKAAESGAWLQATVQECEAYYLMSQRALAEGRKEDGVKWLESCLNTGITGAIEYYMAKAELKRLAPERLERLDQPTFKPKKTEGETEPETTPSIEDRVLGGVAPA